MYTVKCVWLKKLCTSIKGRYPNMAKVPWSKITDGIEVTPSSQIYIGAKDVTEGAVCLGLKETLQSIIIDPGGKMHPFMLERQHTNLLFKATSLHDRRLIRLHRRGVVWSIGDVCSIDLHWRGSCALVLLSFGNLILLGAVCTLMLFPVACEWLERKDIPQLMKCINLNAAEGSKDYRPVDINKRKSKMNSRQRIIRIKCKKKKPHTFIQMF